MGENSDYRTARNATRHIDMYDRIPQSHRPNVMFDHVPHDRYHSHEDRFRRTNAEYYPPPDIAQAIDILSNRLHGLYK